MLLIQFRWVCAPFKNRFAASNQRYIHIYIYTETDDMIYNKVLAVNSRHFSVHFHTSLCDKYNEMAMRCTSYNKSIQSHTISHVQ